MMSIDAKRELISELLLGRVRSDDFEKYTDEWYVAIAYQPSRDEPPVVAPDELVERHLHTKPERLRDWLERNASPEEVMRNASPEEFSEFMLARLDQQAKQAAEGRDRDAARLVALARGRATAAANRAAKRAQKEDGDESSTE